ncbi:MAG: MT-A70 family methyltransferase [Hyalangium sp.]|uniref:MT-A70 family methyltransferase n=1 Tax=Hyalangium sp. TaxID=2028555 RepID=UPI00389B277A
MNASLFPEHAPLWCACVVDPPWAQEAGGGGRGAQGHYPLLSTPEVREVVRRSGMWRPHDDAHLYLWVTNTILAEGDGHELMRALGFRPVTVLTWTKKHAGLGQYFRGQTEHVLFGVRGQGRAPQVLTASRSEGTHWLHTVERGEHSEKPARSYALVEARSHGPYLSMFHRGPPPRPGWLVWGDEAVAPLEVGGRR